MLNTTSKGLTLTGTISYQHSAGSRSRNSFLVCKRGIVPRPLALKVFSAGSNCANSGAWESVTSEGLRRLLEEIIPSNSCEYGATLPSLPSDESVFRLAELSSAGNVSLSSLCEAAAWTRDQYHEIITFSPKVFIPLTKTCRDSCGYCIFAQPPSSGKSAYMSKAEVLAIARAGAEAGCTEALFTLGDKPELRYSSVAAELESLGFNTTLEYLGSVAAAVLEETGLIPHINAGVMGLEDAVALREVSASQGLMLESVAERLMLPGAAHFDSPDKLPAARLASIAAAGEAKELIIQNFQPKPGTLMAGAAAPPLEELLWTVAMARLAFGPQMSIQAPPNLTPLEDSSWERLLQAGINDWGGISPVTRDHVNPEKPWPHLATLQEATLNAGFHLVPRLPVYPRYASGAAADSWLDPRVAARVRRDMDSHGLVRGTTWCPGVKEPPQQEPSGTPSLPPRNSADGKAAPETSPRQGAARQPVARYSLQVGEDGLVVLTPGQGAAQSGVRRGSRAGAVSADVEDILSRVRAAAESGGVELSEGELVRLFAARGADLAAVCCAADDLRKQMCGEEVTYVVNRNINYTNVCGYACSFCAFSKGKAAEALRGPAYNLPLEEVAHRVEEAWARGATEVCMQGGIHPDYNAETYLQILRAAKRAVPEMHVHAFSPLEVFHGASTVDGMGLAAFLQLLKDAGLGSLPGTAAEILDDEVRQVLCPDKINTEEWLEVRV
ncbi:hypothetical protein CYMTET_16962 [Cymbomonas tetramitiformis]|uniref:Radical SAM core domain-containing protein n=1 Tax=Cymbomonas tetramitiformis TaxID=36881 RepID=A0AAE0L7F7_9CHLO|nr:hypothetical protein CYMTET_16962 [Cymbomonas tetramitiformis]